MHEDSRQNTPVPSGTHSTSPPSAHVHIYSEACLSQKPDDWSLCVHPQVILILVPFPSMQHSHNTTGMDILLQRMPQDLYRTRYSGSHRPPSHCPSRRRIPTAISQGTHGSSPPCSDTLGTCGNGSTCPCYQPQALCRVLRSLGCGGCSCAFPGSKDMYGMKHSPGSWSSKLIEIIQ